MSPSRIAPPRTGLEFAECLRRHDVRIASDSEYQARARLLQSLWRERHRLEAGLHSGRPLGSRLAMPDAQQRLTNFLTETARTAVRREMAGLRGSGKLIKAPRIYDDLLSSQPLCFNLFAELQVDLPLATKVFAALHPRVREVTKVEFEWSPGRGDKRYTGDRSAFDVFVEFLTVGRGSPRGFLGIEVKYHERLRDKPSARAMGVFAALDAPALRKAPLQQIWRDHLLAGSLLQFEPAGFSEGAFVFLYPRLNVHCADAVRAYRQHLCEREDEPSFREWHLETVIEALRGASAGAWAEEFHRRYLDFDSLQTLEGLSAAG
jgi:hypothetical protein